MSATITETPTLKEGDVVTILGDNRFTGKQGLIIDLNSDQRPEEGPVAVYFDKEVPDHEFYSFAQDAKSLAGIPTKENYKGCLRVICFQPEELRKEVGFPIQTIVDREFKSYFFISPLSFPLIPGTHACQVKACETNQLATKMTLINVWGTIQNIYTCEKCHEKWHRVRTDGVDLKSPLPGAPLREK